MFVRKKKNRSGSVSVQIIHKENGINRVVKTIGCSDSEYKLSKLLRQAQRECQFIEQQESLFISREDASIESFVESLSNAQIRVVGPELVFGKVYDAIGYSALGQQMFRHLVICRLAYPGSKLKTVDYLYRYEGVEIGINAVYRFMDKVYNTYKKQIEDITFEHTKKLLGGRIGIVFYDLTTLYFEASDEDDLRKIGYSKDGKSQQPQILIGLLVGMHGYPISYQMFEGNTWEGHTLITFLENVEKRFALPKPVIIADAGLLSNKNLVELEKAGYTYILGARLKNESDAVRNRVLMLQLQDGLHAEIQKDETRRVIVHFSKKRADKDLHSRKRGLARLEKNLQAGKLTKSHINNRGYNKYLAMIGDVKIKIDYDKFKTDNQWDGLKGYITNSSVSAKEIMDHYNQLWQIEKAFRISKSDLKIRPIYHRLRRRIESHLCIAFTAYAVYKELERLMEIDNVPFSVIRAAQLTHTMYQVVITLPESNQERRILLQMDENQALLKKITDNIS